MLNSDCGVPYGLDQDAAVAVGVNKAIIAHLPPPTCPQSVPQILAADPIPAHPVPQIPGSCQSCMGPTFETLALKDMAAKLEQFIILISLPRDA